MKETDTISVLVCVHSQDHEHDTFLERALESLVRQTYDDFETVIVLDECWEYTRGVVERYADVLSIRLFERHRKQGLAAAKNFGLTKCNGDWIAYLDADDQYMDCKLEVQRQWMLKHPEIDFCGTHAWDLVDGYMVPNCFPVTRDISHQEIVRDLPRENVLCHGSMMIRKVALDSLDGYQTDNMYLGREDWELWCRAASSGFRFGKVPERLYVYSMGTSVER
jgi:glycosyltransferase involved in cell wall biosynthesis